MFGDMVFNVNMSGFVFLIFVVINFYDVVLG